MKIRKERGPFLISLKRFSNTSQDVTNSSADVDHLQPPNMQPMLFIMESIMFVSDFIMFDIDSMMLDIMPAKPSGAGADDELLEELLLEEEELTDEDELLLLEDEDATDEDETGFLGTTGFATSTTFFGTSTTTGGLPSGVHTPGVMPVAIEVQVRPAGQSLGE